MKKDRMKISSSLTFYYKQIFPLLCVGFLAIFFTIMASVIYSGEKNAPPPFVLFIPAAMAIFIYFIIKYLIFDLVDEVYFCNSHLLVKNRKKEEKIPLSKIVNINYCPFLRPPRVTLLLRKPSAFGEEITFCAPFSMRIFRGSPIIKDLILEVDKGRNISK